MLSLQLLGTPITKFEQKPLGHFRSAKSLALLAYLAMEGSSRHDRSTLINLFWPDLPEEKARQNLSQTITRLRDTLGAAGEVVQANRQAVWLNPAVEVWLDIRAFWRLLDEVEQHGHDLKVTCLACQDKLAQAVALVRGELLAGVAIQDSPVFEEWLLLERERVHQLLLGALADLAEGALAGGRYEAAIEYARRQVALESWREVAHRQLMQALALSGQRAAALAQYESCRQILQKELGVEPTSITQQLAADIRAEKVQSQQMQPAATPNSNLPSSLTPFIGRTPELADIEEQLQTAAARIVTIVGLGGMGKTRLALEVGRKIAGQPIGRWDGVWFIPLAGVDSADGVPLAIAHTLGLSLTAKESPAEAVIRQLQNRRLLLILDNFEHLLEGRGWLLQLLQAADEVQLLITSRERLRLMAEDVYELEGLLVPPADTPLARARDYDAVSLFGDLARRIDKRFRLDELHWPAVAQICRTLEGLPLGIELAVSLLENGPLTHVVDLIGRDPTTLTTDVLGIAPHQRSLAQVFEQSWRGLAPAEQMALARLSLMRGVFTWEDALVVGGATPVMLTRLRHSSLLRPAGIGRLAIHELVRQFAAVKLAQQPAWQQEGGREHAQLYLGRIGSYVSEQKTLRPVIWEALDNIYAAWQWALQQRDVALLLRSVNGLCRFHTDHSLYEAGLAQMQAVSRLYADYTVEAMTAVERELLASALAQECGIWTDTWFFPKALATAERALAVAPPDVDPSLLAFVAYQRGRVALHQGQSEIVLDIFLAGLADARRGHDRAIEAALLREVGSVYRQRGDYLTFIGYIEQALAIYQALEDTSRIQQLFYFLGFYQASAGHYWAGYLNLLKAQALNELTHSAHLEAAIESSIGHVEMLFGRYEQALVRHQTAHRQLLPIDGRWRTVTLLTQMAATQMALGMLPEAADSLAEAERIAQRDQLVELKSAIGLAQGYQLYLAGEGAAARQRLAHVREQMAQLKRPIGMVEAEILQAYIALQAQEEEPEALAVEASLRYVAEERLDGAYQREELYWMAYRVAAEHYPAMAPPILTRGQAFVNGAAAEIEDMRLRDSYFQTAPVARLLDPKLLPAAS